MTNELRLFISSTFRDLGEEREHLVKKIFPEIRALCRERGVTFTEVDLRWGLTEEEAILGQVIRTCLEEVDRCRPYFIGLIGNRYGWVPEFHEVMMDMELLTKYPWIEEVALEGASVTEMEFIHGVFDAPQVDRPVALFYHRNDGTTGVDNAERLTALIERARATSHPFEEFDSIERLGEMVHDDLIAVIDKHWPPAETPSPLELERRAHSAFSASRTRAYIPNPLTLREFARWSVEGVKPLVVHGASGLGKSSLVAYLTEYYRKKNPDAFVVEHYVGASDQSGSAVAIMRHVIEEIYERFAVEEELPETEAELEKSFANALFRAEHLATETNTPILIVLDALNQLGEYGRRLTWLPAVIPTGIKVLLSTTPGEVERRLLNRDWEQMEVLPLEDERVRQSIVVRYLGEFSKGVSPDQLRKLTGGHNSSSPLFLRVVAEELRLHGEYETLDQQIDRFTGAGDLLELFAYVLERIERDHGEENVRSLLSLIGLSRSGLTETELLELTGINRLNLSRLLFTFDYHLIRRNGLLHFFHDYLRRAVERQYLADATPREQHTRTIVDYFNTQPLSSRSAREIVWGYRRLEETDALAEQLSHLPLLHLLSEDEGIYEAQSIWKELIDLGVDIEEHYRIGVEKHLQRGVSTEEELDALFSTCALLRNMGYWESVVAIAKEIARTAEDIGETKRVWEAERTLANVYRRRGSHDAAMEIFERLIRFYEDQDDQSGVAHILSEMGLINLHRGEYDRVLEPLRQALTIWQERGERSESATAFSTIGIAYRERGEIGQAIESFRKALTIQQELGEKSHVAVTLENIGTLLASQGEYDQPLELYRQALTIHEELGEKSASAVVIRGMGTLFQGQGEYDRALNSLQQALAIHEELGEKTRVGVDLSSIGHVYRAQGEYDRALEFFQQAQAIFEEAGEKGRVARIRGQIGYSLVYQQMYDRALEHMMVAAAFYHEIGEEERYFLYIEDIVQILLLICEEGQFSDELNDVIPELRTIGTDEKRDPEGWKSVLRKRARSLAEECLQIAEELNQDTYRHKGKILHARIEHADGESQRAREQLLDLLDETEEQEQIADCHSWIWRLDNSNEEHRAEALRLFTALDEEASGGKFRNRIEELSKISDEA